MAVILREGKTPAGRGSADHPQARDRTHPRPLARGPHSGARRFPLRPGRGHGMVRRTRRGLHFWLWRQRGSQGHDPGGADVLCVERAAGLRQSCAPLPPQLRRKGCNKERCIAARTKQRRARHRYVVTSLNGTAKHLYETSTAAAAGARTIKWHKAQLASDRTSCVTEGQSVRLILHTAAYWLMLTARNAIAKRLRSRLRSSRAAPSPDQDRRPRDRRNGPHRVHLPTAWPDRAVFRHSQGALRSRTVSRCTVAAFVSPGYGAKTSRQRQVR